MPKKSKQLKPKSTTGKHARSQVDVGSLRPQFTWKDAADQGPHGKWSDLSFDDLKDIIVRLESLQEVTRADLLKQKNHSYRDVDSVSNEIVAALQSIGEFENFENLWSFRVGKNITRVWALWTPPLTRVLWLDPEHKGCVSKDFK